MKNLEIKVDAEVETKSAIFIKFSHVMKDGGSNGVDLLENYMIDKGRMPEEAILRKGIYFQEDYGAKIRITDNDDGVTILLPNENYDINDGVHVIDVPELDSIYETKIKGEREIVLTPIDEEIESYANA